MKTALALVLALSIAIAAGCGGKKGGSATPAPSPVHLRLVYYSAGIPGAAVVVNDASGAVVAQSVTDSSGNASMVVPAGGAISVYDSNDSGTNYEIQTAIDPPPGADFIVFGYGSSSPTPTPTPGTSFNITTSNPPAGTASYRYYAGCANQGTSNPSTLLDTTYCVPSQSTWDVIAVARSATGGSLAWGALLAQPSAPGTTVNLNIPLSNTNFDVATTTLASLPASANYGLVYTRLAHDGSAIDFQYVQTTAGGGSLTSVIAAPAGLSQLTISLNAGFPDGSGWEHSIFPATIGTFSSNASGMPTLLLDAPDVSDPLHPAFAWTVTPSSAPHGDIGALFTSWTRSTTNIGWYVWFPPDHDPALRVFDVPASLSTWAAGADTTVGSTYVEYDENDWQNGYAEALGGLLDPVPVPADSFRFHGQNPP